MKTQNKKLLFKKENIVELQTNQQAKIIGGSLSSWPGAGVLEDWLTPLIPKH